MEAKDVSRKLYRENLIKDAIAEARKAGRDEGYKQGLAMKPDPDGVYENGKRDGINEVVVWGNGGCPHLVDEDGGQLKRECGICWEVKLKEVRL